MFWFCRAELCLYEEVVKLPPFKRKTLVLIGANGVGRRTLKSKILESQPHRFAAPLPHTSRPKRPEEDNGFRYWFVDREDMELSIRLEEARRCIALFQCCGSGMFIPDPGSQNSNKREG
jgi:hypothetical protein